MSLDSPSLRAELNRFDQDCYLPAMRKFEHETTSVSAPEWRADDIFFERSGYYDHFMAVGPVPAWQSTYDWQPGNEGPRCDTWWKDPADGLEQRLFQYIQDKATGEDSKYDYALVFVSPEDRPEPSETVRRFLYKEPPQPTGSTDPDSKHTSDHWLFGALGYLGGLLTYPAVKAAMYMIKTALPMFQSFALMCVYIAIPIVVPFAALRPGLLLFFASAIFSLKFLTGIWSLAALIDEKLVSYMYGENELHTGLGTSTDLVLTIVTATSFLALPVAWFWLMSTLTGKSIAGVNNLFAYSVGKVEAAGQIGAAATTSIPSKLVSKK